MSQDRSWMYKRLARRGVLNEDFKEGVAGFIQSAEALSKLYDVCQDDSPQQSEPSSQEESSTTPNISSAKLSSRYLEIVGCNKKRVLGTGSYSKAFLHRVSVCNAEHSSSSRARRLHDFCVFWDARMREFLISEGDQLPPEMPIVDDIIQDKEPDSQPKNFEQTWLPFLKSMGIDAPSFFATSESSKDSMDSLDE
ncbi:unnamed protein product [Cuscuta epithymum]|uniref:Uncharacterized protein n=1 Tax=Cuscuta epithymum TaxID=186058 RepID=A0AAV0CT80_9ASTE|nr:unnamed protein product [Cuscuta epithymum]